MAGGKAFWNAPGAPAEAGTSIVIDVTDDDYGATGDGTTDDTTAFEAAIAVAEAVVAGTPTGESVTIFVPSGTYVTDPLYVTESGITVWLDQGATLKLKAGAYNIGADSVGVLNFHGTSGDRIEQCLLIGGTIDGNRANVTNSGNQHNLECVSFTYADECHAIGVRTINAYSDGFDWDYSADCSVTRCWAEDCGGWGFHASLLSERIRMVDCDAISCGQERSRGGFDQYGNAGQEATDCTFLRCRAADCYQNFDIEGSGAHTAMLRSEGTTTLADVFTGVSDAGGAVDLSSYPSAAGQPAGKIAETDGADGWTFVDTPTGGSANRVWMPLTTVVAGVPELVWDSDNSLIPTEVPT